MKYSAITQVREQAANQSRRRWLVGTVAAAATLGGFSLARRFHKGADNSQAVEYSFWQREFATPEGKTLHMGSLRGKPLLLNFWASWCAPCVEELPLLSSFYNETSSQGWQFLGLAVDELDPVKRFLAHMPLSFPVAMAGISGVQLSRSLGNLVGGLPFTVVINSAEQIVHRKMGQITSNDLRVWTGQSEYQKVFGKPSNPT